MSISYRLSIAYGRKVKISGDDVVDRIRSNGDALRVTDRVDVAEHGSKMTGDGRGFFLLVRHTEIDLMPDGNHPRPGVMELNLCDIARASIFVERADQLDEAARRIGAIAIGDDGWHVLCEVF